MKTKTVKKVHQLYDEAEQTWFDVYAAPGLDGCKILCEVPREERNVSQVRRRLLSKGATINAIGDADVHAAIVSNAPVVHRADRTGWRDGDQTFVSHLKVTTVSHAIKVIPPECTPPGAIGRLAVCGTLQGWQTLIKNARFSTPMMLALCAVFAAPLLKLLNRPSFALLFFGPSRAGKTCLQTVSASAIGFGREIDLPSLNATSAGLLAHALGFNDLMMPINEVATAKGAKSDIYVVLRDATYALMNGQDTIRHPSWTGSTSGTPTTFQTICLFSSEVSPDAWAARNSEVRDDGEMARLIGVPVLLGSNQRTIFDRAPTNLEGAALASWEKEKFRLLAEGLPAQRGVAMDSFLEVVVQDVGAHRIRARDLVELFQRKVARTDMTQVDQDIVAKFGVLFAGGILAIEARILPLEKTKLTSAVSRACLAALAELPRLADEMQDDLSHLAQKLKGGSILNLETCSKKELQLMRDADGFCKPEGNGHVFVVRAQVLTEWFPIQLRLRRVLERLDDEGFLQHTQARKHGRSNAWATKQVSWPDGTRVRSISIFLPNGLADLES